MHPLPATIPACFAPIFATDLVFSPAVPEKDELREARDFASRSRSAFLAVIRWALAERSAHYAIDVLNGFLGEHVAMLRDIIRPLVTAEILAAKEKTAAAAAEEKRLAAEKAAAKEAAWKELGVPSWLEDKFARSQRWFPFDGQDPARQLWQARAAAKNASDKIYFGIIRWALENHSIADAIEIAEQPYDRFSATVVGHLVKMENALRARTIAAR